jgi:hypothetical protein
VLIERGLGASEGEVAAPAVTATSPDTPETVKVKAQQARAVIDKAGEVFAPEPSKDVGEMAREAWEEKRAADAALPPEGVESPTPAKTTVPPSPPPPSPPPRSIDEVLGDPKHVAKKGTVSGRQAALAEQAKQQAAQRADMFSLVCPQRAEHVPGTRCPRCKGIQ